MEREPTIKLEFSQEDAKLISYLSPYKEKLKIIISSGIFEMEEGKITFNIRAGYIKGQEIMKRKSY